MGVFNPDGSFNPQGMPNQQGGGFVFGQNGQIGAPFQQFAPPPPPSVAPQQHPDFLHQAANYMANGGFIGQLSDAFVKPVIDQAQAVDRQQTQYMNQHPGDGLGAALNAVKTFTPGIFQSGYQQSPLNAGVQLFGGLANQATQTMGLNNGNQTNPFLGNTSSFSNQVGQQGYGRTLFNNAMNVAGAVVPEAPIHEGIGQVAADTRGAVRSGVDTVKPLVNNENGFIAGDNARGIPGKWQDPTHGNVPFFEVSDKNMSLRKSGLDALSENARTGASAPLSTVINHPELAKRYPTVFDGTKVVYDDTIPRPSQYNYDTKTIHINPDAAENATPKGIRESIGHEYQHAIDEFEGLPRGTTIRTQYSKEGQAALDAADTHYQKLQAEAKGFDMQMQAKLEALIKNQGMDRRTAYQTILNEKDMNPVYAQLEEALAERNHIASRGTAPTRDEQAYNDYVKNIAEGRAHTMQGRLDMSQRQIDKNPIDASWGIKPGEVSGMIQRSGIAGYEGQPRDMVGKFSAGKQGETKLDPKARQLEVINKHNPMTDEYHTGIRTKEDIKTYEEAFKDPESFVYPDFTKEQAADALKKGKITVYSSKPLESNRAQFVTPSKMQATDYAGGGQIHSKVVSLDEVAWINGDEGQLTGSQAAKRPLDDTNIAARESRKPEGESVFRSERPDRYGVGQAELGSGLYAGSKDVAGRLQNGNVVTDGLHEYKVNPEAKILDSSSDTFRSIDAKASNDPGLQGLQGRDWQQHKADTIARLVQEQGYDGVRRGTNQIVAMSDKALIPVSKDAPQYNKMPGKTPATSPDEIAKTLGMTDEQLAKAKATQDGKTMVPEEPLMRKGADATEQQRAETEATQAAIDREKNAPAPYNELKTPKSWQDARDNAVTAARLTRDNVENVASKADELFGKKAKGDNLFRFHDAIEHPESLVKNAKALKVSPEDLKSMIDAFKQATDLQHSLRSGVGEPVPYRDVYGLHPWDLSDKAAKAAMDEIRMSRGGASHGSAGRERVFDTLREGLRTQYTDDKGIMRNFKLKEQSVGDSIRQWGKQEAMAVQAGALKQAILKMDKNGFKDFSEGAIPFTKDGKPYKVSGVPGLNGWMSPEAYHATQGFRIIDTEALGKPMARILKAVDIANRAGKGIELLGGAFHDLNTSLRYGFQELASSFSSLPNNPLRSLHAVVHGYDMNRAFWDEGHYNSIVQNLHKAGWTELFAKTHLTASQASDATAFNAVKSGNIEHLNPYSEALFSRKIDLMKKLTMVEEAKNMGITDPRKATPLQLEKLTGASDAANARFGGINLQSVNRNPIVQYIFRQIGLAPDFMEGKIRTDSYAVNAFNPKASATNRAQSSLALRQIIGTTLGIGLISELTRQAMGQGSQNLQQAYNNDVKDPSIPLPFTNSKGQKVIGKLPATDVSELTRAFTDPGHYATARLSAGLSVGSELATGKDYFGNSLTDLNRNPNPTVLDNLGGALKSKLTIPGVQASNVANGKASIPEALTNIAGLRVTRDPSDPSYQATQQYFTALKNATKGLTPNQLTDFNALNPTKRDNQGNYLPDSKFNPFTKSETTSILLKSAGTPDNPGDGVVLNRIKQMNLAQPNHDPMWDLSGTATINGNDVPALNLFLKYEQLKADDPGSVAAKEIAAQNPQFSDLNKARSAFFATLPPSKNPDGANPIQYPNVDPNTQALMDQASQITDPAAKSAFYNAHPEITQAFNQIGQYTAARQNQVMAPQFAQAPVASPDVQAAMNAKQWNAPGVQQYLNANSAFKIAGPYGDGIGGGGGGRNTSSQAIANVSNGLQANGKASYASSSRSSASAANQRNKIKNAIKNENRNIKYAMKKSQKAVHKIAFHQTNSLPQGHLAKALLGYKTPHKRIA